MKGGIKKTYKKSNSKQNQIIKKEKISNIDKLKNWMLRDIQKILNDEQTILCLGITEANIDTLIDSFYTFYIKSRNCKSSKYVNNLADNLRKNPKLFLIGNTINHWEEKLEFFTYKNWIYYRGFPLNDIFKEYYE